MTNTSYRAVVCEGGDQVGKADAILTFSEKMIDMGVPVTYASFPMYASPIGTIIRLFLRQGLNDCKISKMEELKVMMSLYALNRLECFDFLLSHPKYKQTLLLFDRGPFSIAITIAYGLVNIEEAKESKIVNQLIDYALSIEKTMIKKLNLDNCVVQLVPEEQVWNNSRNAKFDINENQEVQKASDEIYSMYAKRVGAGWRKIITKKKKGWRDREEIFKDIYDFLIERGGYLKFADNRMIKTRYEIGIEEILNGIYRGEILPEGIINKYLTALRSNDKDVMYDTACIIGKEVGRTCKIIKFKNKLVRDAAKKIADDNPAIIKVIQHFINKEFADKFVKAINEH